MNKLLTFFSDSHTELFYKFFYPSYKKYLSDQFELLVKHIPQVCPSANFGSHGFDKAMLEKIQYINDVINLNDNTEILFFADVDVQFFNHIDLSFMQDKNTDIWFQQDYFNNYVCAGLFFCKCNVNVSHFFSNVLNVLREQTHNIDNKIDDQYVINDLKDKNEIIRYSLLDRNKYWTVANYTGGRLWNPDIEIKVPLNIIAHHANWTIGLDNKIQLMTKVKEKTISME